jgi:hypothetical protein
MHRDGQQDVLANTVSYVGNQLTKQRLGCVRVPGAGNRVGGVPTLANGVKKLGKGAGTTVAVLLCKATQVCQATLEGGAARGGRGLSICVDTNICGCKSLR